MWIILFLKMEKDERKCWGCNQLSRNQLTLDCRHQLCMLCLQELLRTEEREQILKDELEIECPACTYVTLLAIPLAYKLIRPVRALDKQEHVKRCRSMVCMDCLDQCISIESFLQGRHAGHQVLPIDQAYSSIRSVLGFQEKQLQQTSGKLYLQVQKLSHCKGMLNDIFNANLMRLKLAFQSLRDELDKKEEEILEEYEARIVGKFNEIDNDIAMNKKQIELCKYHLEWMDGNISTAENCSNTAQMYEIINYFLNSHVAIEKLTSAAPSKTADLMNDLKQSRQAVVLDEMKQLTFHIRQLSLLRFDEDRTIDSSTCLSSSYFQSKRRQVLNQKSFKLTLFQPLNDKTLKKVASLKSKFL